MSLFPANPRAASLDAGVIRSRRQNERQPGAVAGGCEALLWPAARLGEALALLARDAGLASGAVAAAVPPAGLQGAELARWLDWAAGRLGLEAEELDTQAATLPELLSRGGPALLRVPQGEAWGHLLLLKARRGSVQLIDPQGCVQRRPVAEVLAWLRAPYEAPHRPEVDRLLALADVPAARQAAAAEAMLADRLAATPIGRCWMLRLPSSAGLPAQLRRVRPGRRVAGLLAAFAALYVLEIGGWALLGRATLDGRFDAGWFGAWVLLLLSVLPLRALGGWLDASVAVQVGQLLKQRLMAAALQADIAALREQGAGQLLGRVMETQALESLALHGGFSVLVALLELGFAATLLAAGAGGMLHVLLLGMALGVTAVAGLRYQRRLKRWTAQRLRMTHELVERMVGHRTRLAQASADRGAADDDAAMATYLETSTALDRSIVPLLAALPRAWMVLALLGLAPAFGSAAATPASLGIALGGMLLAQRALGGVARGLAALARAVVAWDQASLLFGGSAAPEAPASFVRDQPAQRTAEAASSGAAAGPTSSHDAPGQPPRVLLDARGLAYRHRAGAEPVLRQVDLTIRHGERILLEGPSGGGKSTLASLLVGLKKPDSGLLLLDGLDRPTLGAGWQRCASAAPQYHENHILGGSLAFNLLMGRAWPPSEDDLREAQALCEALDLGPLLQRMPAGLMQQVGETGWQLSHGERSRIFLARALLQNAPLTVLDESFAALDPQTLARCLATAIERSDALMVIAHP